MYVLQIYLSKVDKLSTVVLLLVRFNAVSCNRRSLVEYRYLSVDVQQRIDYH